MRDATRESHRPAAALRLVAVAFAAILLVGCPGKDKGVSTVTTADGRELTKVFLQTDWYAQPEHGGFYQAVENGLYESRGLAVEIRQGGPNAMAAERLVLGEVQFAITGLADAIVARSRDLPIVVVGAFMQRDPQAILYHQESGIRGFKDLEGRRVMAGVGAAWVQVVKRKAGVQFDTVPLDFGMERFLADKQFVQQCFITSEPFYARQQGANVGTLLIADAGFNPYRVIMARRDFVEKNPGIVREFVAASMEGWRDFLFGDRTRALAKIGSLNPKQTPEFTAFSVAAILEHGLITGKGAGPEGIGRMTADRLRGTAEDLAAIGLTPRTYAVEEFATLDFVPPPFDAVAVAAAPAKPAIPVATARAADTDLGIRARWDGDGAPPSERFVRREDLLASAAVKAFRLAIDFRANAEHAVTGIALADLVGLLGLSGAGDLILADCADGYQSHYDREQVSTLGPVLVLTIDGEGPETWGKVDGNWRYGPHYVGIQSTGDLPDPGSKQPFGVRTLVIDDAADRLAVFSIGARASLSPLATRGKEMFRNHCLSCHGSAVGGVGGSMSSRPLEVVASIAKYNATYFDAVVRDPATAMPGIKMGPHPHYRDEDYAALREFLATF